MRLDERHAEWYCPKCGAVLHAHETDRSARSTPPATPKTHERLPPRLAAIQRRTQGITSSEHRWMRARDEARRLATALGCPPDIADRAGHLIRRARNAHLTQGRDLDAIAAAALLASCRMLQLVRKDEDIARHSKASHDDIQNAYKTLVTGLRLPIPSVTAHDYLAQLATGLGIPPPIENEARRILQQVCGTERAAGKNPRGWAAAGLVIAAETAGLDLTHQQIAKAAGISIGTLRARLKELRE
jgi:transcription initiation factor TFIIIB Brf1 subunit/transcription initiation factor TFIIB